jgi:hypothetical protein
MSMEAIHVHVEEEGKHGKIINNIAHETNDNLWTMHKSWCHVKPPLALNKWPQEGYGTWSHGGKDYMTDIGKLLVDVGSEVEGSLMDQEMRGLAKVN